MEIIPGHGVDLAKIGEHRRDIEARIGPPHHGPGGERAAYATTPMLVVTYSPDDTAELVEVSYSGEGGGSGEGSEAEAHFDGVQLTCRFLDDVVSELHAKGYTSTPSDIGHDFHIGFAVWSTGSLWVRDLDSPTDEDEDEDHNEGWEDPVRDERAISEGLSVAAYSYLTEN